MNRNLPNQPPRLLLFSLLAAFAIAAACASSDDAERKEPPASDPAPAAETTDATSQEAESQTAAAPAKKGAPLIERSVLFGNPERAYLTISPTGDRLAFMAPNEGVLNVWVAPLGDIAAAKAVTQDKKRGIRMYRWTKDGKRILFLQDKGGDENWHVWSVSAEGGEAKDLSPYEGVQAQLVHTSSNKPNEVVLALNDRDKTLHDLFVVDVESGKRTMLVENDQGFIGYEIDEENRPAVAIRMSPEGGLVLLKPDAKKAKKAWKKKKPLKGKKAWKELMTIPAEDMLQTNTVGVSPDGKTLYLTTSKGRDTAALVEVDIKSGTEKVLFEPKGADATWVFLHPRTKKPQLVRYTRERMAHHFFEESGAAEHFAAIDEQLGPELARGDTDLFSATLDDDKWVVRQALDAGPDRYYLYDKTTKKAELIFVDRPELEGKQLAKMHPVVIKARDGLELVSYLSLPVGSDDDGDARPDAPLPTVLFVHGGPWARDRWGFNRFHQWLANRGYAVLSVNYRGSTGFGKAFTNAADKEWAGKMHDDLVDATQWLIDQKVAPADKIAIAGGSYGGYSTLVGLTFTPELYACGVDIVGPSSLVTLLQNIPPYWVPIAPLLRARVGDWDTEEGKAFLTERSPLSKVDAIQRPLLIGQGANDPRVKQAESDQIVAAMNKKSIPVTYAVYPDEGHGFRRPENMLSFSAVTEHFLAGCLGGQTEPYGKSFEGSSLEVSSGANHVEGLEAALKTKN